MKQLKMIVILGFPNSGKSTLIQNLFKKMSGQTNWPSKGQPQWQRTPYSINAKTIDVYFGSDGDDYSCVSDNIRRIANGSYDVAIIAQTRSVVTNPGQSTHYVWGKWIDRSICALSHGTPSIVFPDHERFYVHSAIPQFSSAPDYTGQIQVPSNPNDPRWTLLSSCTENYVDQLLHLIV